MLLIAICTIIELKCAPNGEALNRWRYNFVGGMLPFSLGLLYAKYMRNSTLYCLCNNVCVLFYSLFGMVVIAFLYGFLFQCLYVLQALAL